MPQTNKYCTLKKKKNLVYHQSNDKAAISFQTNAETPEAAARYDNLHFQAKLERLFGLVEQTVMQRKQQYNQFAITLFR